MNKLAIVRLRGRVGVRGEVKDTLRMLNLTRPNYCTLVDDNPSFRGMLEKVKEMATWGPIKPEVLEELLVKKGEFSDGRSFSSEEIKKLTPYDTVSDLAGSIVKGDYDLDDINDLRKIFRLHPPKKGYESLRRGFEHGGALGDRGEEVNNLILRML
ncbi:hypothetical protein AKJ51_04680 [candidate division MSBL1 archaeon SCGC-AAA382A20]|uniref:Large ribosomal subunit protein uL30 n=1 Tax=candidate division MSBL1 archaeon SCGC-AAA382A20 TaxID=1698280 RepID=A0A133VHE6_9EURY|nr:hypothetical protein AKJ51_04680 [candidate division MSBL1 archaeon SCGC-AAA382A20]